MRWWESLDTRDKFVYFRFVKVRANVEIVEASGVFEVFKGIGVIDGVEAGGFEGFEEFSVFETTVNDFWRFHIFFFSVDKLFDVKSFEADFFEWEVDMIENVEISSHELGRDFG